MYIAYIAFVEIQLCQEVLDDLIETIERRK